MKRLHCLVSGIVQGVNFRGYTRETATRLGLRGWVRNLPDGRVEVLAQGADKSLQELHNALRQGSPWSRVRDVACQELPDGPDVGPSGAEMPAGFVVLR